MGIQEHWEKALRETEVVRHRVQGLQTFAETKLPYIFLAESSVNMGDSVVRKGRVLVEKPALYLPSDLPQFKGFHFEDESKFYQEMVSHFLMVRGVRFPSLKYENRTQSLDIFEGKLSRAVEHFSEGLRGEENVSTGLIVGPEDCWQFSVLIFTCMQMERSAESDLRRLMEEYKRKRPES